jgi:hypothetical protein
MSDRKKITKGGNPYLLPLAAGQEGLWPGGQREVGRDFTRKFQTPKVIETVRHYESFP